MKLRQTSALPLALSTSPTAELHVGPSSPTESKYWRCEITCGTPRPMPFSAAQTSPRRAERRKPLSAVAPRSRSAGFSYYFGSGRVSVASFTSSSSTMAHMGRHYEWTQPGNDSPGRVPTRGPEILVEVAANNTFPVRSPNKATLSRMQQYYNPSIRLLQRSDRQWQEMCTLTKGEQQLLMGRKKNSINRSASDNSGPPSPSSTQNGESPGPGHEECPCEREAAGQDAASNTSTCVACARRAADSELRLAARMHIRERLRNLALPGPSAPPSSPEPEELKGPHLTVIPPIGRGKAVIRSDGHKTRFDIFLPRTEESAKQAVGLGNSPSSSSSSTSSSCVPTKSSSSVSDVEELPQEILDELEAMTKKEEEPT